MSHHSLGARLLLLCLAVIGLPGYALIRVDDGNGPYLRWTRGYDVPMHIDTRGHPTLPFAQVRAALERALSRWHQDDTTLRFVRDPDGRDGDSPAMDGVNLVRFERVALPPEVDPRHTLAFTSPVSGACTGVLLEADITFNAVDVRWSTDPGRNEYDLESVMVHEVGHLFGLDHTQIDAAIMFPSIGDRVVKRVPQADDLAGLRALYGLNRGADCGRNGACAADEVCLFTVRSDETFDTFCGPPLGAAGPGQRCDDTQNVCENGCANGLCVASGTCSAVCQRDQDCAAGQTCLPQDTGGGQRVNFCLTLDLCEDDFNGCARGQACGVAPHPTDPTLLYLCLDAGPAATGEPCRSGADCAGTLCDGGRCTELCLRDGDCPVGYPCQPMDIPLTAGGVAQANVCRLSQTPCTRPNDCAADEACAFQRIDGRVQGLCLPANARAAGEPCAQAVDCSSRICLAGGLCSSPCFVDRDCPVGMRCGRAPFAGVEVSACTPTAAADAGAPDAGESDASVVRDAGATLADGGRPDGGQAADAGPVPDGGGATAPDGGRPAVVVREGGGGGGGCRAVPGRAPTPRIPWLLAVLGLLGGASRRRRR